VRFSAFAPPRGANGGSGGLVGSAVMPKRRARTPAMPVPNAQVFILAPAPPRDALRARDRQTL